MRKAILALSLVALLALFCAPASAWVGANTLYGQEGTASDGYSPIDASG